MKEKKTAPFGLMLVIYLLIVIAEIAADRIVKHFVVANIELNGYLKAIPGVIHLTYIRNYGASFSILQNARWFFLVVTAIVIVAVVWLILKRKLKPAGCILLSVVIGGAIGNAFDRAVNGYVVDMFETEFVKFAIFNVADIFIVVGGILFAVWYIFFNTSKKEKKADAEDGKGEE